jgi:DNA repair ATPase RecN
LGKDEDEDPRTFWVKGWKRVGKVLKADKKEKFQLRNDNRIRQELREIRQAVTENNTQENREKLLELEETKRKLDHFNAHTWRKRSRIKWLKLGETPTK